jgi:hypothetical protein
MLPPEPDLETSQRCSPLIAQNKRTYCPDSNNSGKSGQGYSGVMWDTLNSFFRENS